MIYNIESTIQKGKGIVMKDNMMCCDMDLTEDFVKFVQENIESENVESEVAGAENTKSHEYGKNIYHVYYCENHCESEEKSYVIIRNSDEYVVLNHDIEGIPVSNFERILDWFYDSETEDIARAFNSVEHKTTKDIDYVLIQYETFTEIYNTCNFLDKA